MQPLRLRSSLLVIAAACAVGACSLLPPEPPADKDAGHKPDAAENAAPAAPSRPAPAPRPKPARTDKDKAARPDKLEKQDKTATKGNDPTSEAPPPASEAPILGPAWLTLCKQRQIEAGIILCDTDELLVRASAQVKIFTRDPAATGRGIQLRKGLPYKYRFFVVP